LCDRSRFSGGQEEGSVLDEDWLLMSGRWSSCCSWMLLVSFETRWERSFISFEARRQRSSGETAGEFRRNSRGLPAKGGVLVKRRLSVITMR
jgi:hypothetical protein